jgi:hypothetical protein
MERKKNRLVLIRITYKDVMSFFVKLFHVTHPSMDGIIHGKKLWQK